MTAEVQPYAPAAVPVANMTALDAMEPKAREIAVTSMLAEARGWLAHAVEATQPQALADFKAWVGTIEEATRRKGLAKDIQLDAAEMLRRAERGLGVAIRDGQHRGEVETVEEARSRAGLVRHQQSADGTLLNKPRPTDYASHAELGGTNGGILDLADGVSDEAFEHAIESAKDERNLSRANVIRKAKHQPATSTSKRHELLRGTRRIDVNRVIGATVTQVAYPCPSSVYDLIDVADADHSKFGEWIASLSESIKALRSLKAALEREANRA